MAKKKKKNATLTGALGSYLEEKFGNKEEKKTTSKVTTDENGNVTINNSPKKEREGILVTGVKKTISGKSSIPSKILGLATNGIGEVIYNTVEAGINESKNKKVEQTVDTIKKDSDTAYNKLKDYKKENNINLFNENSKRVQNDEKYQGLLKETQEKTTTLEKERTNRNSEIIKDAVKEKSGTLSGGIIKTGTTLAGGFETGIGGIESTTKKILGQTPSLDDQEIKYNMFSDVAQNNINTTKNPVGRAGLEMTYSIGQMLPQMMTGNSAGAFTTGFANYGGSAYNQAKKDGATEEQATKYGIVSGTLEMAMEKALGGFESVYGKSVLGNSTNKLTSKVLDKFVKNKALRKTLTSMKGEFTEEYLQEFLGPIVEEALLNKDNGVGIKNTKNVKEIAKNLASYTAKNFFSTQNLYAGTLGAVTSGVMEGPQNIARNQWTKQTGRDFDTGYTQNEQKVIDEIVNKETTKKSREQAINTEIENAIKEQEQNFSISEENKNKIAERIKKEYENKDIDLSNTKLSDKEIKSIRKSVEKSLQEGTIDADEISNILGNDTDISKDDLRRSMAMVIQETHLFTGTIADNIRYGKLDATDEEVREAAVIANADSFIRRLPDGYDTMLYSDGSNLSQGQRQLLAIARAAVAKPPVLILDEATSSVDTRTERLIENGMDAIMEGRTVFVIAHRLSTVRNSKAIMVLEKGQIIERGSHDELIEQKGRYYQLYTGQFELE